MRKVSFRLHHSNQRYQYLRGAVNPGWYMSIKLKELGLPPSVDVGAIFSEHAVYRDGAVIDSYDNFLAVTKPFLKSHGIDCVSLNNLTKAYKSKFEVIGLPGRFPTLCEHLSQTKKKDKGVLHKVYVYHNPDEPEVGELVTISIENKLESVMAAAPSDAYYFYNSRTAPVIVIRPDQFQPVAKKIMSLGAKISKPMRKPFVSPASFLSERNAVRADQLIMTDQDARKTRLLMHKVTNQPVRVRTHFYQKPSEFEDGVASFLKTMYILDDEGWKPTNHWLACRDYRPLTPTEMAKYGQIDMFTKPEDKTSLFRLGSEASVIGRSDLRKDAIEAISYAFNYRGDNNHQDTEHSPVGTIKLNKKAFLSLWESMGKPELGKKEVRVSEFNVYFSPGAFAQFKEGCDSETLKRISVSRSDFPAPDDYQFQSYCFDPHWLDAKSFAPGALILLDEKPAYWMGSFNSKKAVFRLKRSDTLSVGSAFVEAEKILEQNPGVKPSPTTIVSVDGRRYLWESNTQVRSGIAKIAQEDGSVVVEPMRDLVHRIGAPTPEQKSAHDASLPKDGEGRQSMLSLLSRLNDAKAKQPKPAAVKANGDKLNPKTLQSSFGF